MLSHLSIQCYSTHKVGWVFVLYSSALVHVSGVLVGGYCTCIGGYWWLGIVHYRWVSVGGFCTLEHFGAVEVWRGIHHCQRQIKLNGQKLANQPYSPPSSSKIQKRSSSILQLQLAAKLSKDSNHPPTGLSLTYRLKVSGRVKMTSDKQVKSVKPVATRMTFMEVG